MYSFLKKIVLRGKGNKNVVAVETYTKCLDTSPARLVKDCNEKEIFHWFR